MSCRSSRGASLACAAARASDGHLYVAERLGAEHVAQAHGVVVGGVERLRDRRWARRVEDARAEELARGLGLVVESELLEAFLPAVALAVEGLVVGGEDELLRGVGPLCVAAEPQQVVGPLERDRGCEGRARRPGYYERTHVSLNPPPWDELTMAEPPSRE